MSISLEQNQKILSRLFHEVWDQKKLDVVDEIFHPNVAMHIGESCLQGIDALKKNLSEWFFGFPDMRHEIEQVIPQDSFITIRWWGEGTHLGTFRGMLPTRKKISFTGITIYHFKEGKVDEGWLSSDLAPTMEKLQTFTDKTFSKEDFNEDFEGPAKLILERLLRSNRFPAFDFAFVNTNRAMFGRVPVDDQPSLKIPREIMEEVDVQEKWIPSDEGYQIRCLIYTPISKSTEHRPLILYIHGGGWVIGTPESADLVSRKLAFTSNANVVSLDYRLAPEFPYPAALNDCVTTVSWLSDNGEKEFGIDTSKIAISGDSAGGNLSITTTLMLRDKGLRMPDAVIPFCPLTDFQAENYASFYPKSRKTIVYNYSLFCLVRSIYADYRELQSPYLSPMYANLSPFPPTFMLSAGEDPLIDENKVFVAKCKKAGVDIQHYIQEKMPHSYYYFLGMTQEEDQAYKAIGQFLKTV